MPQQQLKFRKDGLGDCDREGAAEGFAGTAECAIFIADSQAVRVALSWLKDKFRGMLQVIEECEHESNVKVSCLKQKARGRYEGGILESKVVIDECPSLIAYVITIATRAMALVGPATFFRGNSKSMAIFQRTSVLW